MKAKPFLTAILAVLVLVLIIPSLAPAEVVGRLTKVEGRVDLLKGGKLPATPVKVGDSVENGDVLRCKSLSRAQITFMDNSIVTLSPRSRLAIKDYMFEPAQHKRNAVLHLFQGLAHVVVNKLYKIKEPDFIIKTATAITGVRGTDFGVRLAPDSTTILNFEGKVRVASNFPEVGAALRRAGKIAFGLGSKATLFPPGHFVDLGDMQGTEVRFNLPPTLPFALTAQDRKLFMHQLIGNFINRRSSSGPGGNPVAGPVAGTGTGGGGGLTVSTSESSSSVPAIAPTGLVSGTGNAGVTLVNAVTIPPVPTNNPTPTPTPTPTPGTFTFTQQYYGSAWMIASDSASQSNLQAYSLGQRTGVYAGYFSAVAAGSGTASSTSSPLVTNAVNGSLGSPVAIATGTVSGTLGQTLTGTMTLTNTANTFTSSGTVSISPTGELTYNWTSTSGAIKSGTTTQMPGTYFSQSVTGNYTSQPNQAGNQAVATNLGTLGGTQIMNSNTPNETKTPVYAGFSVTNTSPNANDYSFESGQITIDSQGVLGAPDSSGKQTGVMTGTVTTTTATDTKIGGPVTNVPDNPTTGTPQAMLGQVIGANQDANHTTVGAYAQTSSIDTKIVTQSYPDSGYSINPTAGATSPPKTGDLVSAGTGSVQTADVKSGTYVTIRTVGTMNAAFTDPTGVTQRQGTMAINGAAVISASNPAPTSQTGPAQVVGVVVDNNSNSRAVVSAIGTATVVPNTVTGTVTNLSGNFVSPNSRGTVDSGNLKVYSTLSSPMQVSVASQNPANPGPNQVPASQSGNVQIAPTVPVLPISATVGKPGTSPAPNSH